MSGLQEAETAFNTPGLLYRNPFIPSAFRIPTELTNGSRISIAGYISNQASGFYINLQQGKSKEDDIFFHLNARFDDDQSCKAIVRNARYSGNWGWEEREIPEFPFSEKSAFIVAIIMLNNVFVVEVNGNKFISFKNRIQPFISNRITHVLIEGSVFITDLHLPFQDNNKRIDRWLSIPGVNKIGDTLALLATTPSDKKRFAINFLNKSFSDKKSLAINFLNSPFSPFSAFSTLTEFLFTDDIAFHFNPRFDSGKIILNSRSGNIWGEELSDTSVNIGEALKNFLIIFSFDENTIRTIINEQPIQPFINRIDQSLIRYCLIESDIVLKTAIFNVLPINKAKCTKVTLIQTGLKTFPFKSKINPSKIVIVSGKVQPSPERFYVNLQLSSHDIALHFNPRWNDQKTSGATLLFNSKIGDKWASEIREPMILKENIIYDFIFKFVGVREIEVIINGLGLQRKKVAKISHPFTNGEVNHIEINGSFDAMQIALIN